MGPVAANGLHLAALPPGFDVVPDFVNVVGGFRGVIMEHARFAKAVKIWENLAALRPIVGIPITDGRYIGRQRNIERRLRSPLF